MSRCRCCDIPLTGQVRYKDGEDFHGLFVEEDFCTRCIFETEMVDYIDVKTYQFEDLTDELMTFIKKTSQIE